jgi:hypothetical protein
MFDKKRRTPIDPDLQVIATLERAMVRDRRITGGGIARGTRGVEVRRMKFNFKAWGAAHHKFVADARTLTDDDIAQLATTDRELAEKARAKRAGFVRPVSDDERQRGAKSVTQRSLEMTLTDVVVPSFMASLKHVKDEHDEKLRALGKQLEDARTEIAYLMSVRDTEAIKR